MGIFDEALSKLLGDGSSGKMDSPQDQPQEDQELFAYIKQKVEEVRAQATRISHEGVWMTNIAYLLGFDSVYYDPQLRQFRPAGTQAGVGAAQYVRRNRIHANLLLPAAQNRLARMNKVPPRYDVRPNSMEEEDKEAARLGVDLINDVWDRQAINRKRIDLGMWLQECGHSYIGVHWDDELGEPLKDPVTSETMGKEGDVRVDVASAFECFADPLAKTLEECGWFIRCKVRKLDYFRTRYPERGALVKEEGPWLLSAQYEMRINTLNTVGPSNSGTSEQMKHAAIEIHYYEAPSAKYPDGRHVVGANGVLLKNAKLPYGEIPYAKFDDIIVAGKYYSEAAVTHARPLQDQYNRTLVKRADWVNKLLAGKYIAARGHSLAQEALNDQSGEVVEYDPQPNAPEPHPMQLPVIPSYAYEETKEIERKVNDVFGLSEVSQGKLPSASIPAIGIQLLLEQDETRIGIEIEQHEHSWARVGKLILKCLAVNCITDRKLKQKKGSQYKIRNYNGDSLRQNFDAIVIRGSTVPNSKVIHRQEIMNLYGQGLLGNPQDPHVQDTVLGLLQYGDIGEVWEDQHLDKMQIERDLELIENEVVPEVDEKNNAFAHTVQKNRYRKSEKFRDLSDTAKLILQENIQAYLQILTKQTNPQLASPPPMPPPPPSMAMGMAQAAGAMPQAPPPPIVT